MADLKDFADFKKNLDEEALHAYAVSVADKNGEADQYFWLTIYARASMLDMIRQYHEWLHE